MIDLLLTLIYSIYFNFRYLKFNVAIKLPILIHWRTEVHSFSGTLTFINPARFCFRIGIGKVGFNRRNDSCVIKNEGDIVVSGSAYIGQGSELCNSGTLYFGDGFNISASSRIICINSIKFGANCLVSWGCQIMDCDFHKIYVPNRKIKNPEIVISDNVWIGNSVYIYKGVKIGEGNIISANSIIKKGFSNSCCIITSQGGEVIEISKNVRWEI
ncbi:TPA: hypothetical protein I7172_04100 [Vibrio vulnificus]|nr:hypothetical protein [Vibrio vulnificus]